MKLSICIPIYNFDVRELVQTLHNQIRSQDLDAEIVLIDDASKEQFKLLNREIRVDVQSLELEENIGRAKIRNKFLEISKGDYLLFLDCDGKIENNVFIANYLKSMNKQSKVICGGRIYPKEVAKNQQLNWKFGIEVESKTHIERSKKPYSSFMTNNFVVQRNVLEKHPFNEAIRTYGHEDTLFGFELMQHAIPIIHINNPIYNAHIEENEVFLQKSLDAVKNLHQILNHLNFNPQFIETVRLLKFYYQLKRCRLLWVIKIYSPLAKCIFQYRLKKGNASLFLFNIYKLAAFDHSVKRKEN